MASENCFKLRTLSSSILFREKETDILTRLFGPPSALSYPSIFIYGHSSVGKTLVLSNYLKKFDLPHVWVNCREALTLSLLLQCIVEQIPNVCISFHDVNVNNMCDLINVLKDSLKDLEQTVYFVFDNAEMLKKKFPSVLPILLRLQEVTKLNVSTILVSDVVWEKFRGNAGLFEPIAVHFPDYSKEQLIEILCLDCPSGFSKDFYEGYANIIMKVFFVVTRDLNELRHVAHLNFAKYSEPVLSGELKEINTLKLFRNIESTLKDAIHAVYLREVSGPKWTLLLQDDDAENSTSSNSVTKFRLMKELPFYSKFLLLASYFASYNLPKSDIKHFVKNQGKQKKKSSRKKTEKNRHLLGPKAFTLDRMLCIFFSIVGHSVLPSALILSQISSLCSLQLLSKVSVEEQLDVPKYKCLAELDLVRNIGKTVNIDVMNYLDDFI